MNKTEVVGRSINGGVINATADEYNVYKRSKADYEQVPKRSCAVSNPLKVRGPARQVLKEARGRGNQGDHLARRQHSNSKYSPH